MPTRSIASRDFSILGIFFVITLLVYIPGLHGPFVYDDQAQILSNSSLHHFFHLKKVLFCGLRQPRVWQNLSFALNWSMGNGESWIFKVFNLLLHFTNAVLLFRFLKVNLKRSDVFSYFTVALFLIHPLQIQSVTYIMGRVSLIEAFFKLLLLNFLSKDRILPICSLLVLSYFGKESNLLLPFLVMIYYLTLGQMSWGQLPKKSLAFYFSTVIWVAPIFYILADPVSGYRGVHGFSLYPAVPYFFTEMYYYFFHLFLFFNPANQSIFHQYQDPGFFVLTMGFLALVISLGCLSYAFVNRLKSPQISFFILFFFFCLAPTNSFLQMVNPFAEYRLYCANISLFVLVAGVMEWVIQKNKWNISVYISSAALLVYWSSFTFYLNTLWRDNFVLLSYASELYPKSALISGMLGEQAYLIKDFKSAEAYLRTAIEVEKTEHIQTMKYQALLARVYLAQGRAHDASDMLLEIRRAFGAQVLPAEYFELERQVIKN